MAVVSDSEARGSSEGQEREGVLGAEDQLVSLLGGPVRNI